MASLVFTCPKTNQTGPVKGANATAEVLLPIEVRLARRGSAWQYWAGRFAARAIAVAARSQLTP
jgi:hypothetical protein